MERNSALCPKCRRLISLDEEACPYCGLSRPGSRWRNMAWGGFLNSTFDPVKTLIFTNIAMYILTLLLNPSSRGLAFDPLLMLSPSDSSLYILGATGTMPVFQFGRWWTLFTASFLHGGILHIVFNMIALSQLSPFVLAEFGFYRFAGIYIISGVAGFLLSCLAGIPFTLGASASICGLIGAILYYGKSRGGFYGENIYRQAMGWVVGLVLLGLLFPSINNWAHMGGLFAGIAVGFILGYEDNAKETGLHRIVGGVCLLVTLGLLLLDIIQAFYTLLMHASKFR